MYRVDVFCHMYVAIVVRLLVITRRHLHRGRVARYLRVGSEEPMPRGAERHSRATAKHFSEQVIRMRAARDLRGRGDGARQQAGPVAAHTLAEPGRRQNFTKHTFRYITHALNALTVRFYPS